MAETMENNGVEAHVQKFEYFEHEAKQPAWVFPLRKAGIARFAELGFPTLKQEDWRFTNVAPIAKLPFKPLLAASRNGVSSADVEKFTFGSLPAVRLDFVNGHYLAALSTPGQLPRGAVVQSLASALTTHSGLLEKHLARFAQTEDNAFTALNTAFFQDGAFIYVPAGITFEMPIHLLFISTATESGATAHPRNLIIAEKASQF